jgi:hypothetical protein
MYQHEKVNMIKFSKLMIILKTNKLEFNETMSSTKTLPGEAGALLKEVIQKKMKLFLLPEQVAKN